MLYDIPLQKLPKTSARTVAKLTASGINSIGELLETIPYRYEDYRKNVQISELEAHFHTLGESTEENDLLSKGKVTLIGEITKKTNIFTRRGFSMQKLMISDDSGSTTVTWFNQPFLLRLFTTGTLIAISGAIKNNNGLIFLQPDNYELVKEDTPSIHTGRIVPIYSSIPSISLRTLREKMFHAVSLYGSLAEECLPEEVLKNLDLLSMADVLKEVHFPSETSTLKSTRERMSFNELFSIQLKTRLVKEEWKKQKVLSKMDSSHKKDVDAFLMSLPYTLTGAQERSVRDIIEDMSGTNPMNRLLQGDVGSGKTIVAVAAALYAFYNSKKTVYMAPTEILAQQQIKSISALFSQLPKTKQPRVSLVTSNSKISEEDFNNADILIGTHALISGKRSFSNVGLIIIDEQHKFGVSQRAALKRKGINPHLLNLTATPIPRTVLLTLYGELDVSVIDEFPKGRKEIKTILTPELKREDAYAWIKKELFAGHQLFIVCPFIEQSEAETLQSVKAASEEIKKIETIFKEYSAKLLHGRLKADEKDEIMKDFAEGKLDILVSTPVVEVGIDVPNASVIIIEGAERFGLAQLHQLRGRVGRSNIQSYCLLFSTNSNPIVQKRLSTFCGTLDGYELARYDLKHRGGGNVFGTQQHGYSPIALETLLDGKLTEKVQKACGIFVANNYKVTDYPYLVRRLKAFHIEDIAQN